MTVVSPIPQQALLVQNDGPDLTTKTALNTAATERRRRLEAVNLDQVLLGQLVAHQER